MTCFPRTTPSRIVAIDWSGANPDDRKRQKGIWMAYWQAAGDQVTLAGGLSREEVGSWLAVEAKLDPRLVVGMDFSFGFPLWFARKHGATAREVWGAAERKGEEWLREASYPFWRDKQPNYPVDEPQFRRTERELGGRLPNSTFKLVGDGQVGAGSVRGMRTLLRLTRAGFAVWPFDRAAFPLALEIYPTACYPRGTRASVKLRRKWLQTPVFDRLSPDQKESGANSGDAFDALAALAAMVAHRECFAGLADGADAQILLEGQIWAPDKCGCWRAPVH